LAEYQVRNPVNAQLLLEFNPEGHLALPVDDAGAFRGDFAEG
jgi:hypothetical protein